MRSAGHGPDRRSLPAGSLICFQLPTRAGRSSAKGGKCCLLPHRKGYPLQSARLLPSAQPWTQGMSRGVDHPAGKSEVVQINRIRPPEIRLRSREISSAAWQKSVPGATSTFAFHRVPGGMGERPARRRSASDPVNHHLAAGQLLQLPGRPCMVKVCMGKDQELQHSRLQSQSCQGIQDFLFRSGIPTIHQDGLTRPVYQVSGYIHQADPV